MLINNAGIMGPENLRSQPAGLADGTAMVITNLPTYCATKAALHSYTQSLRYQLKNSPIQVLELVPPHVATTLMGDARSSDPNAMPLSKFISEVMDILRTQPTATEICVQRVYPLRFATDGGQQKYEDMFTAFNDGIAAAAHR